MIAQLGLPDMRIPIQYALTFPQRLHSQVEELRLWEYGTLTFSEPDRETFRCLPLCIQAMEQGGLVPAAVNGANEKAVELFLAGKIGFLDIPDLVQAAMEHQPDTDRMDLRLYCRQTGRPGVLWKKRQAEWLWLLYAAIL